MTLKDHGWGTIIARDPDSGLTCEGVLTDGVWTFDLRGKENARWVKPDLSATMVSPSGETVFLFMTPDQTNLHATLRHGSGKGFKSLSSDSAFSWGNDAVYDHFGKLESYTFRKDNYCVVYSADGTLVSATYSDGTAIGPVDCPPLKIIRG